MSRIMGVNCAGADAYITVLVLNRQGDGVEVLEFPNRVQPIQGMDPGDSFSRTLLEWNRAISAVRPDHLVVLLPESGQNAKATHSTWAPRCSAETLASLAANQVGVPVEHIARATVRARLGIKGRLPDAVKQEAQVGPYWSQRGLALLAARAKATTLTN